MSLEGVDPRVVRVVDVKTPRPARSSAIATRSSVASTPQDLIKFVICDRDGLRMEPRASCASSVSMRAAPCCSRRATSSLPARDLADWILEDRLPVRFQIQLHKYLWGNVPRRSSDAPGRAAMSCCCRVGGSIPPPRSRCARSQGSTAMRCPSITDSATQPSSKPPRGSRRRWVRASIGCMRVDLAGIGGSALTDPHIAVPERAHHRHPDHLCAGAQYHDAVAGAGVGRGARRRRHLHRRERRRLLRLSRLPPRIHRRVRAACGARRPRRASRASRMPCPCAADCALQSGDHCARACGWAWTSLHVSCYQADAQGRACGRCDSCRIRRAASRPRVPDPTRYQAAVVSCRALARPPLSRAPRGVVAQSVEHRTFNPLVEGSIPSHPTTSAHNQPFRSRALYSSTWHTISPIGICRGRRTTDEAFACQFRSNH